MTENVSVTGDGFMLRVGSEVYWGPDKVKVREIGSDTEQTARIMVIEDGRLYGPLSGDELMFSRDNCCI